MKLILKDDVKGLGGMGQEVDVADGYGRNYLIPKGLAMAATVGNLKILKNEISQKGRKIVKLKGEAEDLAKRIEKISCRLAKKAGESDKLFGSVTSQEIAEQLKKEGFNIDKRKIDIDTPIKNLGTHSVSIRVYPGVVANLKVEVVKE
ncbi:MAG TPA: 50S ribosomal protein L9 [Nitrospinae bacterium]|nr:50S ribosomal protein L9 [Nitrospinota bacterium]HBA26457.1 50S ribosomal protein L9 [Nitrospinota bacterium]